MRTKSKQLKELATLLNEVRVRVTQICTSRLTEKIKHAISRLTTAGDPAFNPRDLSLGFERSIGPPQGLVFPSPLICSRDLSLTMNNGGRRNSYYIS